MFYIVSKTLGLLLHPTPLVLLIMAAAAIAYKRKPRAAMALVVAAGIMLALFSTAPLPDLLLAPLEAPYRTPAPAEPLPAIVVLSGGWDLWHLDPRPISLGSSGDRIINAIVLALEWPDSILVFSGGSPTLPEGTPSEAELAADLAERFGVNPERIRTDRTSRNTRENAIQVKRILQAEGINSFLLVTSAYHMKRSLGCFRRLSTHATAFAVDFRGSSPGFSWTSLVPESGHLSDARAALHEYVGLLTYRLAGYL